MVCRQCKEDLDISLFVKDRSSPSGIKRVCKTCHSEARRKYTSGNLDKVQKINRAWVAANPEKIQRYRLNKYNISLELYLSMLETQGGKCAVCLNSFGKSKALCPRVDHDHSCCEGQKSCGKCIRGLLCDSCNVLLGRIRDNTTILQRGISYLSTRGGYQNTASG